MESFDSMSMLPVPRPLIFKGSIILQISFTKQHARHRMHVKNSIIKEPCSTGPGNGDVITYKEKPDSILAIEETEFRCMPNL